MNLLLEIRHILFLFYMPIWSFYRRKGEESYQLNSREKLILNASFLSSHVAVCLSTVFLQNSSEQNSPLNHSRSISRQTILSSWQAPWSARFSFPNCLLCADKDGFSQFYFLRKKTKKAKKHHFMLKLQISSLLG